MKKIIALLLLAFMAGPLNSLAQHDNELVVELNYNISLPVGQLKDFISKTGTRGFEFEMKYMLNDNIAVGGNLSWYGFTEEFPRTTYYFDGGALTAQVWNYMTVFPFRAVFNYYFLPEADVNPYIGILTGAYYVDRESDIGYFNVEDKSWHFGITPKLGCYFPFHGKTEWGVNFNAKYNYITYNKTGLANTQWNNLMFFDFSVGVMVLF